MISVLNWILLPIKSRLVTRKVSVSLLLWWFHHTHTHTHTVCCANTNSVPHIIHILCVYVMILYGRLIWIPWETTIRIECNIDTIKARYYNNMSTRQMLSDCIIIILYRHKSKSAKDSSLCVIVIILWQRYLYFKYKIKRYNSDFII